MTSTGKAARKRYGNRFAAKRAKPKRSGRRSFGKLPVSNARGNALAFVLAHGGDLEPAVEA